MNEVPPKDPDELLEEGDEELVPEDDTIIGQALKWSGLAVLVIAGIVGAVIFLSKEEQVVEEVKKKEAGAIEDLVVESDPIPVVRFRDVTQECGIDFDHESGARGEKLLPECMGAGVAIFDYDSDGDPDLLFINGRDWPHVKAEGAPATQALYQNDGAGKFTNVTRGSGLDITVVGMGVAVADYDGDGDPDLYLTTVGKNLLFRNDNGRFVDVTAAAGVAGTEDEWGASAGFFDYDQDGDLDIFVCNYVQWSPKIDAELAFTLNGRDRAYGPPTNYQGSQPYLFRNDGNGRFTEVAKEAGMHVINPATQVPVAKSLAVAFEDHDGDGDLDVYVANDTTRNFIYINQGDGSFKEIGQQLGFAYDNQGKATGAMGIDVAHYRNDDTRAFAIANFANEMTSLFVTQPGNEYLSDEAIVEGIGSPSRMRLSFGLFFFDYDFDGRLDLLQANGHLEEEIHEVQKSQHYRQPAQLFWNSGPDARSCYVQVPEGPETADLFEPIVGRAAGYSDLDGDGDLDVILTQTGGRPRVLRNEQGLKNHWLAVRLTDKGKNRDAIGAEVTLTAGGLTQKRRIMPTRSYLTQLEPECRFGLGRTNTIDSLEIVWPDGTKENVPVGTLSIDQRNQITRK